MSIFKAEDISISFGGLRALDRVSFDVNEGEIFSIIGPNGAGKTTIFNCLSRFYDLDGGKLIFKGKDISRIRPHQVADQGIARTFQNIELFSAATVIDNLLLSRHRFKTSNFITEALFTRSVRKQEIGSREKAEEVIDFLDLQAYRDQLVANLPYGVQKTVELGRALSMEPSLLLLDEPSSGLNSEEIDELTYWLTDIKEELGITLLLVEHNIKFVQTISERILALNFGKPIAAGTPKEVLEHPEVIRAYLGEDSGITKSQ